MPSNCKPIERPQRARISAEVLEFFLELERMPRRQRDSQVFKDGEHELARRLNLVSEFWSGNSVLDRDQGPCWLPSLIAHHDWYRLREINCSPRPGSRMLPQGVSRQSTLFRVCDLLVIVWNVRAKSLCETFGQNHSSNILKAEFHITNAAPLSLHIKFSRSLSWRAISNALI